MKNKILILILVAILPSSYQALAQDKINIYETVLDELSDVVTKINSPTNKYLKVIRGDLESIKKSITDMLENPTTFCNEIITEAADIINSTISDADKKVCKKKRTTKCIPKTLYDEIVPILEKVSDELHEDSDENSFLDICEDFNHPLGCLINDGGKEVEIGTTNNDTEITLCNSNEKIKSNDIFQSNTLVLSSTTKIDSDSDVGNIEMYKYSLNSSDLYFAKNTSLLPIEVKVELNAGSTNVTVDIPQTISLLPKEERFVFKVCATNPSKAWNYEYSFMLAQGFSTSTHTANGKYFLPFKGGESYEVVQGETGSFSHFGDFLYSIDFDLLEGTEFTAMRDGIVTFVKEGSNEGGADQSFLGKANFIWVLQPDYSIARYVHLKQDGAIVNVGDKVKVGDVLGYSGNTGFTSGPHLHVQVVVPKGFNGEEKIPIRFKGIDGALTDGSTYTAFPMCGK
ncbi:MAG: peptidoglycan DD-metalloendopeptidase family protein [Candidatus Melainabacteria bacterium]|nr:peptidoglycan DD-metalloendopeptidase family protein [Candidatus Melainabacteria bacterium]